MSKKAIVGNLLAIPLKNGLFGALQIVETDDTYGVFWIAGYGLHFEKAEDVTVELVGSVDPVIFGQTTDALLARGDWKVVGRSDEKATEYRPAFRELISSQGVFVLDAFKDRHRQVTESEIEGLPNQFSRSPAGIATVLMRYPTKEGWIEQDEKLLIKPEWDVKNFFQD